MSEAKTQNFALVAGFVAAILSIAGTAHATSSETAMSVCSAEMEGNLKALDIRDLKVRRHDDVPCVYGNADFADIKNIHFRCEVRRDTLQEVRYLVKDPEFSNGRMWVTERPQGKAQQEILFLDEPAMSAPPPVSPGPHFIRVPQSE